MTSAPYLEEQLKNLRNLPNILEMNFKLMRHLDYRAHGLMRRSNLMADEFLPNIPNLDEDTRTEKVNAIQAIFTQINDYSDDKVQVAIQTYALVDKHIRRLDKDIARFESENQKQEKTARAAQKATADQEPSTTTTTVKKGRKIRKGNVKTEATGLKKCAGTSSEGDAAASGSSAAKKKTPRKSTAPIAIAVKKEVPSENSNLDSAAGEADSSDVWDMPVDPNEPTFCICHQVSYGAMIGCDNPECPIEWFHFACVNIKIKPKGKWYCLDCSQDGKNK
ncbi:inhibitor of growth protein 5-like [Ostrinia nubilalis]|uniref:inhibitor of growth protein 5-like n=1 Tax=Ostrinia nubilalis TaxID=29057 RepID=UPI00308234D2